MADEVFLTPERYKELEEERDMLASDGRKGVSERLKEAISYGDLSENAEFDAAKNEQAELEERILKIEDMLRNAKIINKDEVESDVVNVGVTVDVLDCASDEKFRFIVVGSTEADPFAEPPKVSNESMVGSHLIGKKIGETAEIPVPDGTLHYEILNISK